MPVSKTIIDAKRNSLSAIVSGPFRKMVSQIWTSDRMAEYVSATDARRQVWHAFLAALPRPNDNDEYGNQTYHRLTFDRSRDILSAAYGSCPPGAISALGRMGAFATRPEVYRALIRVLAQGGPAAKYLQHSRTLPESEILGLAQLSPVLATTSVVNLLNERNVSGEMLASYAWMIDRLQRVDPSISPQRFLKAPKPLEALREAIKDLPFPPPPWEMKAPLVPVTSFERLRELAKSFENCLTMPDKAWEAATGVQNGRYYFAEWRGEDPALLLFARIGSLGWLLKDAKGPKNALVPEQTAIRISRALVREEAVCSVWPDRGALPIFSFYFDDTF